MTSSVHDLVQGITPIPTGLSMRGPRAIIPLAESTGVTIHRDRLPLAGELLLTSTDGTAASLEDLAANVQRCAKDAHVLVLLTRAVDESSPDAVAAAMVGAGAEFMWMQSTSHAAFPTAALIRRTDMPDERVVIAVSEALLRRRGAVQDHASVTAGDLDIEARARLDRVRAETARLRIRVREAESRAERAERALARVQASTSLRLGRRLVQAAKSPRTSATLPRDLWRMWRLRTQRRSTPSSPAAASTSTTELSRRAAATTGSHLLNPRATAANPLSQLSVVAVASDATALTLGGHCALTRVLPHSASAVMEMVDADLVLIDTDAASAPSAWAHLGDPSATDRERALVDLIDTAHAQGRPVVLVRSGDPSRSATLHSLASRCDLVLTASPGIDAAAWNAGVDLGATWLPAGPREGAVFVGQCDARWSSSTRDALLAALRAAPSLDIHDWSASVSVYRRPWPDDLASRMAAPLATGDIAAALEGRAVGLASPMKAARGLLHPSTAAMLAGGLRVVSDIDPNLDEFAAVTSTYRDAGDAGDAMRRALSLPAVTEVEHRRVLRELFLHHATPVMLQRLVDAIGVHARPLAARDIALVTALGDTDADAFVEAVLRQRVRPFEVLLTQDTMPTSVRALRDEGIDVHCIGGHAAPEQIGLAIDCGYALAVDPAEWLAWPDTHLLDAAIDLEVEAGRVMA